MKIRTPFVASLSRDSKAKAPPGYAWFGYGCSSFQGGEYVSTDGRAWIEKVWVVAPELPPGWTTYVGINSWWGSKSSPAPRPNAFAHLCRRKPDNY